MQNAVPINLLADIGDLEAAGGALDQPDPQLRLQRALPARLFRR